MFKKSLKQGYVPYPYGWSVVSTAWLSCVGQIIVPSTTAILLKWEHDYYHVTNPLR